MSHILKSISIRGIVNSIGGYSVEADVLLDSGDRGRASIPVALAPGRREVSGLDLNLRLGKLVAYDKVLKALLSCPELEVGQVALDDRLSQMTQTNIAPPAVCLAVSMAYARAVSGTRRSTLWEYIEDISGLKASVPAPIINIFSGGIHAPQYLPFQNVMAVPLGRDAPEQLAAAIDLYFYVRDEAGALDLIKGVSPAGGLILGDRDGRFAIDLLQRCIVERRAESVLGIGIDVAAEHLKTAPGRYQLAEKEYNSDDFAQLVTRISEDFKLAYVEDPFDSDDPEHWRSFTRKVGDETLVVADDLFATNAAYVASGLATAMMVKLTQVGSLSAAVEAARCAADQGMKIVTSHRSVETEDTFVSELSVGLGASFQKVGGPIGSDRTAKMNVLLRAFDEVNA